MTSLRTFDKMDTYLEEATSCTVRRCWLLACATGAVNLQTNAVRVLEEDAARICPFSVCHNSLVQKMYIQIAQPLLEEAHLIDTAGLEREMVQARTMLLKSSLTLLPERQHQPLSISKMHVTPPLL